MQVAKQCCQQAKKLFVQKTLYATNYGFSIENEATNTVYVRIAADGRENNRADSPPRKLFANFEFLIALWHSEWLKTILQHV